MSNSSVVVQLLDKEYQVGCAPDEQEQLLNAARFLDGKLREVRDANVIGIERIAIMAALNLAHELLQANSSLGTQQADSSRISSLLEKVEQEIEAHKNAS